MNKKILDEVCLEVLVKKPTTIIFILENMVSTPCTKVQAVLNAVDEDVTPAGISAKLNQHDILFSVEKVKHRSLKGLVEELCQKEDPSSLVPHHFKSTHIRHKERVLRKNSEFFEFAEQLKAQKVKKVVITSVEIGLKNFKLSKMFEAFNNCLLISPVTMAEHEEKALDEILELKYKPKKMGPYSNMLSLALAKKVSSPQDVIVVTDNKAALHDAKAFGINSFFIEETNNTLTLLAS